MIPVKNTALKENNYCIIFSKDGEKGLFILIPAKMIYANVGNYSATIATTITTAATRFSWHTCFISFFFQSAAFLAKVRK